MTLIPFGAKVTIEKSEGNEIFLDGRYGKWVNVKYGNNKGWVFSGFLCNFKPDIVIKPVADFYREKYRKEYKSLEEYKWFGSFEDSEVTIKNIIDNYIVLNIPMPSLNEDWKGDVVWGYEGNKNFFLKSFMVLIAAIFIFYI